MQHLAKFHLLSPLVAPPAMSLLSNNSKHLKLWLLGLQPLLPTELFDFLPLHCRSPSLCVPVSAVLQFLCT